MKDFYNIRNNSIWWNRIKNQFHSVQIGGGESCYYFFLCTGSWYYRAETLDADHKSWNVTMGQSGPQPGLSNIITSIINCNISAAKDRTVLMGRKNRLENLLKIWKTKWNKYIFGILNYFLIFLLWGYIYNTWVNRQANASSSYG